MFRFKNFCNEGAWWWFWWTETCSAWLYGIKVLCLTVHFLCVPVIVNISAGNRIHVYISQVHLPVSWMNNCTNYVRNSLLAKRFLGNKNYAVCVGLDNPALDQYCRMWIIRSTWSSLPDISSLPEAVRFLTASRATTSELVTLIQSSESPFHVLSVPIPMSILNALIALWILKDVEFLWQSFFVYGNICTQFAPIGYIT